MVKHRRPAHLPQGGMRRAAVHATTGNLSSWNPNANAGVSTLVVNESSVYAGGGFTNIGNLPAISLAAVPLLSTLPLMYGDLSARIQETDGVI
ncbi:hypothetical protein [Paraflavitalea speifideaquila]|uniref:hypothetical protein n=1 Tax=Paraflavitalea speifideaquila TaxID=3076558 RepID=UPI0028EB4BEC|nr:hypothetical protein [Paraflavitalea speifideiaquila]